MDTCGSLGVGHSEGLRPAASKCPIHRVSEQILKALSWSGMGMSFKHPKRSLVAVWKYSDAFNVVLM